MKKRNRKDADTEQVIGFDGPGRVVNFFDPYPEEDDAEANNSDMVDLPAEKER
ncbi:hypothetical protein [Bacillus sp. KH172YL63]|uniref:hypothetical protein n=1 Tax=Bacillus sp. KH172YL63 TaxID=2709784 RepID=UPI0013E44F36|nr:hypothetical protein [Bacillus sp. KH172YL63]BCB03900.1 hypothetical protein KH172YL63_20330 [Bacillus sp. KH172YL63]